MQSQTRKNCLFWYKFIDYTVAIELLRRVSTLFKGLIRQKNYKSLQKEAGGTQKRAGGVKKSNFFNPGRGRWKLMKQRKKAKKKTRKHDSSYLNFGFTVTETESVEHSQ